MTPVCHRKPLLGVLAVGTLAALSVLFAAPALANPAPPGTAKTGSGQATATTAPKKTTAGKTTAGRTTAGKSSAQATFPATPPAVVCGVSSLLTGPASPPAGAVVVGAGDNSGVNWNQPGATFWFAPGTHTLGGVMFSQIIAATNATYLGGPGAVLDGQGINRYAFTQTASGVTIRYLTIQNYVAPLNEAVVNHDSGVNWVIQYNTIIGNSGAGVVMGPGDLVQWNCLKNNGQYGFSAVNVGGDSNVTLDHNEIAGNNTGNWEVLMPGCGCVGGGKVWDTTNAALTNNWVHDNHGPGLWADNDNAGILIDGNYIANNDDEAIIYEVSYNGAITNNNIQRNAIVKGKAFALQNSTFPIAAIYISNSGGDSRVDGGTYSTFNVAGNNLVDNWGGVSLWEDANRFCGSDPTGICTIGSAAATLSTCVAGTISIQPYLTDCQWLTQNVSVHDNSFSFYRANVGCSTSGCGEQAIVANPGTAPPWSPYLGNGVVSALTTSQNNHFANNTYIGDWQFAWSNVVPNTFTQWQGNPMNQDAGSTLNGISYTPATPGNLLDADSASLEGSVGHWVPWFSSTIASSTAQAQLGTHSLQVNVTAIYGWGVQMNNYPGFTATAGPQTMSFWGLAGSGTVGVDMQAQWRDKNGTLLATNDVAIGALTSTWQQASASVTAPPGTASLTLTFASPTGAGGVAGNSLYLDQIFVGPPQTTGTNLLDADTATLEGSAGHWVPWFSTSVAQTTAQAETGSHSLQVNIVAPYGWGVQLNNSPGFAAAPGPQTMSFWGMLGSGALSATMQAQWRSTTGGLLATTSVSLPTLTSSWQLAYANVIAPAGTALVTVTFNGAVGVVGNSLYLDQIFVGSTPSNANNLLDADTATLEGSAGHWIPWFSCSLAQTTSQAQTGSHSLQVNVSAPFGWGVQSNTWPGFAATPGAKTIRFWGLAGNGTLNATMQVQWRNALGLVLGTDSTSIASLTSAWQQAGATANAPAGTTAFTVTFNGSSGVAGNSLYLDQIYVGT